MRAPTPQDELEYLGDVVALPQPRYAIGTELLPSKLDKRDREYYGRMIFHQMLADLRTTLARLNRQGFALPEQGKRLLPVHKGNLRKLLHFIQTADTVEVAGLAPTSMHVGHNAVNQCYLQNGQCHGGVSYVAYLLFRKTVDGRKLVYLHPHPVIREEYLKAILAPSAQPAAA